MKCDRCDSEATVRETLMVKGKVVERHLCAACAAATGIKLSSGNDLTELITQYVNINAAAKESKGRAIAATTDLCPGCGLTFAIFRQHEKLGCAMCYQTFERQISGLLQRLHQGATHHIGKAPKRQAALAARLAAATRSMLEAHQPHATSPPSTPTHCEQGNTPPVAPPASEPAPSAGPPAMPALTKAQVQRRVATLKKRLEEAVASEQYEKAAQVRDQLRELAAALERPAPPEQGG